MEKIICNDKVYSKYDFSLEKEFESKVVEYSKSIFGNDTVYFDTKKRISKGEIIAIPDGYLIDFTFENNPRLYIVENELSSHDVFRHIGEQILFVQRRFLLTVSNMICCGFAEPVQMRLGELFR